MNVTVLTYLEREGAETHDIVVDQVAAALRKHKHSVKILGVHGDVQELIAGLRRQKPQLVFNLMEMFARNALGDVAVAGALGCNLGSLLAYWIGARGGRPAIERWGRLVLIGPHELAGRVC